MDTPARLLCFVRATLTRRRPTLIEVAAATAVDQARAAGAIRAELLVALDDAPQPQVCDLILSLWFTAHADMVTAAPGWSVASSEALAGVAFGREIALVSPRRLR